MHSYRIVWEDEAKAREIELLVHYRLDAGVVSVQLVGACGTCPSSVYTLRAGIERILRDRVEGVTELVAVE